MVNEKGTNQLSVGLIKRMYHRHHLRSKRIFYMSLKAGLTMKCTQKYGITHMHVHKSLYGMLGCFKTPEVQRYTHITYVQVCHEERDQEETAIRTTLALSKFTYTIFFESKMS